MKLFASFGLLLALMTPALAQQQTVPTPPPTVEKLGEMMKICARHIKKQPGTMTAGAPTSWLFEDNWPECAPVRDAYLAALSAATAEQEHQQMRDVLKALKGTKP